MLFIACILLVGIRHSQLTYQEDDVFYNLAGKIDLPDSKINIDSPFTITNNGHSEIGRHALFCQIVSGRSRPSQGIGVNSDRNRVVFLPENGVPISSDGDAESQDCFNNPATGTYVAGPNVPMVCLDVIFGIQYALTSQPKVYKQKSFRYVSEQGNGYRWLSLPLLTKVSPCAKY
jgi:hypothetical protein